MYGAVVMQAYIPAPHPSLGLPPPSQEATDGAPERSGLHWGHAVAWPCPPQSSLGLLLELQNPLSLSLPSGLPQTTFQGSGQALGAGDLGSHPDSALTLSVTNQALSEPQSS